jgi:hypothetical protein
MSTLNSAAPEDGGPVSTRAKATDLVGEIFKLMPATAGIMLALIWGLADRATPSQSVLDAIRVASIILVVSIILSLAGLQFTVAELQNGNENAASKTSVQVCFVLAWITFIVGSAAVVWSLFLI